MPTDLRRPARTYTIGELCREFECTARALRFYEDKGLLAPAREGQHRIYSNKDRARLQLILRGKRVGLPLDDIRDMLDLYRLDDGGARQAASSIPKFQAQIAALERQRADIEAAIVELKEGIALLEKRLSETQPELLPQSRALGKPSP